MWNCISLYFFLDCGTYIYSFISVHEGTAAVKSVAHWNRDKQRIGRCRFVSTDVSCNGNFTGRGNSHIMHGKSGRNTLHISKLSCSASRALSLIKLGLSEAYFSSYPRALGHDGHSVCDYYIQSRIDTNETKLMTISCRCAQRSRVHAAVRSIRLFQ